jgi:hypothetical protein
MHRWQLAPAGPLYRGLFPDWTGPRPVNWFFGEQFLEARSESRFPTNADGPDEDVNIYIIQLLTGFLGGHADPRIVPGVDPLLAPPDPVAPRRQQAAWYRVNADHRLLLTGLFDRGDDRRRRRIPFGVTETEARERDMEVGRHCYELAANLLEGRPAAPVGLARVLRRLADNFSDYVHVLGVLATRHWGLGAVLSDASLARLLREEEPAAADDANDADGTDAFNGQNRTG